MIYVISYVKCDVDDGERGDMSNVIIYVKCEVDDGG